MLVSSSSCIPKILALDGSLWVQRHSMNICIVPVKVCILWMKDVLYFRMYFLLFILSLHEEISSVHNIYFLQKSIFQFT